VVNFINNVAGDTYITAMLDVGSDLRARWRQRKRLRLTLINSVGPL